MSASHSDGWVGRERDLYDKNDHKFAILAVCTCSSVLLSTPLQTGPPCTHSQGQHGSPRSGPPLAVSDRRSLPLLATPTSHLTGPSLPATSLPGGCGPAPLGAPLACTLVNPDASAVSPAQAWPLLASQPHLNAQPAPPTPPAQHRTPVPPALRPRLLSQALPWGHDPSLKPHSDVGLTPFFS